MRVLEDGGRVGRVSAVENGQWSWRWRMDILALSFVLQHLCSLSCSLPRRFGEMPLCQLQLVALKNPAKRLIFTNLVAKPSGMPRQRTLPKLAGPHG